MKLSIYNCLHNINIIKIYFTTTHSCRRKASAANYRRAERAKVQAQEERQDALKQIQRVKRQKSRQQARFQAKEASVQDLKKVAHSHHSLITKLKKKAVTLESRL